MASDDVLREMLDEIDQRTVAIGRTHTQFDRRVGEYHIINAGSVGAAWEIEPGACWALLDNDHVELRRSAYDIEAAIRLLPADDPNREMRAQWVRGPHDPQTIAQRLETALGR